MKVILQVLPLLLLAAADAFTTPAAVSCQRHLVHSFDDSYSKERRCVASQRQTKSTLFMSSNGPGDKEGTSPSMEDVGAMLKNNTIDAFSNMDIDMDTLKANVLEGEVGERGEGWTAAWLLLISFILLGGIPIPFLNNLFVFLGGPGLMIGGGAVILASLNDLGSNNLTPFLSPVSSGSLVTDGIFGKIRHPIYAGLIALCAGFSILTGSAPRLVITAILILVLNIKSDKEEEMLSEAYPAYAAYKAKVTGKFIPADWTLRQEKN